MKILSKERVNKALLKRLYSISSPSGKEDEIKKFLSKFICKNFGIKASYDEAGNMYVVKGKPQDGTYPCIVAHCDEVQCHEDRKGFEIFETLNGSKIFGMNTKTMERHGLGADDKNGIWIALNILATFPAVKVVFFVQEERGDVGSRQADMEFFKDVKYVIECDRKGGSDFIINACGTQIATNEFVSMLPLEKFGYKVVNGGLTDVAALRQNRLKVCSCNMSCGYYNPHQKTEYTDYAELLNTLRFVKSIIRKINKVCVFPYEERKTETTPCGYPLLRSAFGYLELSSPIEKAAEMDATEDDYDEAELYEELCDMFFVGVSQFGDNANEVYKQAVEFFGKDVLPRDKFDGYLAYYEEKLKECEEIPF